MAQSSPAISETLEMGKRVSGCILGFSAFLLVGTLVGVLIWAHLTKNEHGINNVTTNAH